MNVLLKIAASLILVGAIFRIQHWAYDDQLFMTGLISSFILGSIEINRLKKIIKSEKNGNNNSTDNK
ncbi:GldL-related protein [Sunxiuqinia indica]|uniref:GldL-related protein n=1 Tax=Sunxiuqinia indica TaxID=2692584 RepID=UPI001915C97A|nr:hypothetical protein [Sunxiuqinia indica]